MTNTIPNIVRTTSTFTKVEMKHIDLYFSYDTLIAFCYDHANLGETWCVMNNYWGSTTGRHLNQIDGGSDAAKARRVTRSEFANRLGELNL